MAVYPIKLDLVNCTDNNSSTEYVNDNATPSNLLRYDTTGLTGDVTITDKQGTDAHHFNVTVTVHLAI